MSTNIIQQMKAIESERERMFAIYCADTGSGDMHRPFDNYRAGYKAATTRHEAKIKALRNSLNWALSNISEEPYEWSSEEDADAHNAAIAAAKETP